LKYKEEKTELLLNFTELNKYFWMLQVFRIY